MQKWINIQCNSTQQAQQIALTTRLSTWVINDSGNGTAQSQPLIDLLQQQHAAITGDVTTVELGFNAAALTGWKGKRLLGTFCHGQSLFEFSLSN